jgi:hypothetical protein
MEPHLSLTFPYKLEKEGVRVLYPVLINTSTIIEPTYLLRTVYVPPRGDDDKALREARSAANREAAYSRRQTVGKKEELTAEMKALIQVSRETVWPYKTMFQLAFAQLSSNDMRIVFSDDKGTVIDQPLFFPEGLLLVSKDGEVTALAVEKKGNGANAGIGPEDRILQLNGTPLHGSLRSFLDHYMAAKEKIRRNETRTIAFWVQSPGKPPRSVEIRKPLSLGGSLLDSPIDPGPSGPTPTPAAPVP